MNSNKLNRLAGFTLLELLITMSIMGILTVVVLANYRTADRSRRVQLAADTVLSALTDARNASQAGKKATGCITGNSYTVRMDTSSTAITVGCSTNTYQTYNLPSGTRFRVANMRVDNVPADKIYFDFYPPFAQLKVCSNPSTLACSPDTAFISASVIIESISDTSITRTVTVDGVSGRIQ